MKKLTREEFRSVATTVLSIALVAVLVVALAGCRKNGTNGAECYRPGDIRIEHPEPSTTETFKCVTDKDGHHAHWVKLPNNCREASGGLQFCAE